MPSAADKSVQVKAVSVASPSGRVDRAGVGAFLALAFGISWTIWIGVSILRLPWWIGLLAAWGPGAAALLVRAWRREGLADSGLLRLGRGRGAREAYAIAFLLTAATVVVATSAGIWVGVIHLAPDAGRAAAWPDLTVSFVAAHFGLPGLAASFLVVPMVPVLALGEELGWRDYLLPRLMPLGERNALLLSSAIWAAWHLPYNLVLGYNGGLAGFPLFPLYAVLFGALLGRTRLRSGSIWPAAILHAAAAYQPQAALAVIAVARSGFVPSAWVAVWQYATAMVAGLAAVVVAKSTSRSGGYP